MCRETIRTFDHCRAKLVHRIVCLEHIEHTRKQIDNFECPNLKREEIVIICEICYCKLNHGRCERARMVAKEHGHTWDFEKDESGSISEQPGWHRTRQEDAVRAEREARHERNDRRDQEEKKGNPKRRKGYKKAKAEAKAKKREENQRSMGFTPVNQDDGVQGQIGAWGPAEGDVDMAG